MIAFSIVSSRAAVVPGHVEAWGNNRFGQSTPPPGLDGVIAVAGGGEHSLALLSNGTVVAWGRNSLGQTDVPSGLNDVKAIAAYSHSVALRNDGTVVVWGFNQNAVTNVPLGLNGVKAIAVGMTSDNAYTMAVRSNGTVVAWGLLNAPTNVPTGLNDVVAVATGSGHALALKSDGTIVGWGGNGRGQASPPPGLSSVVAIAAGQLSSLAVRSDGTVVKWGSSDDVPPAPPDLDGVVDVRMGLTHAIALRSNAVAVAWGSNFDGEGAVPVGLNGITVISAGANHNLVITARPLVTSISPPVVANPGDPVTFTVTATGAPLSYQWRRNGTDRLGATNASLVISGAKPIDAGVYTVLVSNPHGSTLSPPTSLTFPTPVITRDPQSVTRYRGESASFEVAAIGVTPFTYQWLKDSLVLQGLTSATLTLANVRTTNAANYQAIVIDAAGAKATGAVAVLTIIDPTLPNFVTLTPVVDTSIFTSGTKPQGEATILAGTRRNGIVDRGLLRFNLGGIPPNVVFQSAELRLTVIAVPRTPVNSNFSLYRFYKPWESDATWENATSGSLWSGPGGLSGVDYSASASATQFVIDGENATYTFGHTPQMAADLEAWTANPGTNWGWMLKSDSEVSISTARHFGSSESAQSPQLSLQYVNLPPPFRLTNVMVQAGRLTFRFEGAPAWFYRVEYRDNVDSGIWNTLTNVPAGPATSPVVISVPVTGTRHFYRVAAE